MTPINLVLDLVEKVKEITKHYRFPESDGKRKVRAPRVWAQHLPEKLNEDEVDAADFPFIIVALGGGNIPGQDDGTCQIAIWCAAYDDGLPLDHEGNPIECMRDENGKIVDMDGNPVKGVRDQQGWLYVGEMIWRIVTKLIKNPTIGPFVLEYPINWDIPVEWDPVLHWHGIINMTFSVPVPKQAFNFENQNFYNDEPMCCPNPQHEEIITIERM